MRVAFVGIQESYKKFSEIGYVDKFTKYHIELPWYCAEFGGIEITIVTDYSAPAEQVGLGHIRYETVPEYLSHFENYDVVVHWRVWKEDLWSSFDQMSILYNTDHHFENLSPTWISDVRHAYVLGKLRGILTYGKWHKRNTFEELKGAVLEKDLFENCIFGVDDDVYRPSVEKSFYNMLWTSDPGRGLNRAIDLALRLFHRDKKFRLHICYPFYVRPPIPIYHPALVWHGNMPNGPELWELFGRCGVFPYTSNFPEPSCRSYRQSQSCGNMVLYPPGMGNPSETIVDGVDGFVRPIDEWEDLIIDNVKSGRCIEIGQNARKTAESENWRVQAKRFVSLCGSLLMESKR